MTLRKLALPLALSAMTGLVAAPSLSAQTTTAEAAAVDKLVGSIQKAVDALPADASSQDVQAAVAFVVDQSGMSPAVIKAALDKAGAKYKRRKVVLAALDYLRRGGGLSQGTGGLAGSSGFGALGGPTVGGGGGLTNGGGGNGSDYGG